VAAERRGGGCELQRDVLRDARRHRERRPARREQRRGTRRELRRARTLHARDVLGRAVELLEVVVAERPVLHARSRDVVARRCGDVGEPEVGAPEPARLPVGVVQPAADRLRQRVHLADELATLSVDAGWVDQRIRVDPAARAGA
jgi:hypothetical protein